MHKVLKKCSKSVLGQDWCSFQGPGSYRADGINISFFKVNSLKIPHSKTNNSMK